MFRHDWETLADFFIDLAKAWKGFEGQRHYRTVEHDIEIRVTSDASGHNHFTLVLRDGPTSANATRARSSDDAMVNASTPAPPHRPPLGPLDRQTS